MASLAATMGKGNFKNTGGLEDVSDNFKAAISVSGAYDLVSLSWGSEWCPSGEDWHSAREYASPLKHVSSSCKPMLLFHSDDDSSVPIKQALEMAQALEANNVEHEFVHYEDQGHLLITDDVMQKTLDFIEKHRQKS